MFGIRNATLALGILYSSFTFSAGGYAPVPEKFQYCTVCHGSQLKGSSGTNAPRLSHLPSWYVENQLHAFKNGWRGVHSNDVYGNEMRIGAEALEPSMIQAASNFVASTSSPNPISASKGNVKNGQKLYSTCSVCHGPSGEGNQILNAPPLAGGDSWYLVRQLENFKHGYRGSNPEDINGITMKASTATLPDEQSILDVVTYIQSLTQK